MRTITLLIIVLLLLVVEFTSAQQISSASPRDGVVDKSEQLAKKPISYPWIRKADYIWDKRVWRVIDMREKMNQAMYYPDKPIGNRDYNYRRSFASVLLDAVQSEGITAYNSDEFILALSPKDIKAQLLDSIKGEKYERPNDPDNLWDTTYLKPVNPWDIKKIRIKEDWFFDKQRSMLEVRIIGICPVADMDVDGEIMPKPLFWIYFPEIRPLLAEAEVFNRFNGAAKLTYDDFFWKRMFSSYIYKVDNQYDRTIAKYTTGMDAILESERIKEDLFNFEQQLWEY